MRWYSFFFPSLSPNVCSLSCIFQCAGSLHLYRWPPIAKQDHASSGVQRFRPQKELKPKAAGEYFHGWGWKVRLRLGSHRDTEEREKREGRVRRGNLFLFSCSWASTAGPCIKKTTAFEMSPYRPRHGRMLNTTTWVIFGRFGEMANVKSALKRDKYVSLSAAITLWFVAWTVEH